MSHRLKRPSFLSINALLIAAIVACTAYRAEAATIIDLGTAGSFSVLGATSVTNTGLTVLSGNLGVSNGAITGFGPGVVNGTIHTNDTIALNAHDDASAAYTQLANLTFTENLSGQDLGGLTLETGVYSFSAAAGLTGVLTLDGPGLFVFQIGSTLTTGISSFNFINGASADDVWFNVGSSATLGTGTVFSGTLIASESATLGTDVSVNGRILALNGAVTLASNEIALASIPEPAATALLVSGLALLVVAGSRARNRKTR